MKECETRYCEVCGARINRRGVPFAEYAGRRYCSLACSGRGKAIAFAARSADQVKTCARCGATYRRPAGLSQEDWKRRQFCNATCQRGAAATRVLPVCECGNVATHTVYFVQGRSDGSLVSTGLEVCADCAEYMLEHDPGCSRTPRAVAWGGARLWADNPEIAYQPPTGGFTFGRSYHD